nr:MAG TPA: hypothetical protein [Caudoviricetes sp.]
MIQLYKTYGCNSISNLHKSGKMCLKVRVIV